MTKNKDKSVSIFKAYLIEIKDRWFSSSKRVLSTIGVLFIPFIYAFTCIAAFWDPLPKIGMAPMSIVSLDKEQLVVCDTDAPIATKPVVLGIPLSFTTTNEITATTSWNDIPSSYLASVGQWDKLSDLHPTFIQTQGGSILNYNHTVNNNPAGSCSMLSLIDQVMTKWQNGVLSKAGFGFDAKKNNFGINFSGKFPINNIKYHNIGNSDNLSNWATDANQLATYSNNSWDIKNYSDYVQISIPEMLTTNLVNFLDANISDKQNPSIYLNNLHDHPINLYLTYEKTFLAPRIINEIEAMFPLLISGTLPIAISSLLEILMNDVTNKIVLPYQNGGYSWTPAQDINIASAITWNDHSYNGTTNGTISETLDSLHLEKGKYYTIPNEEFRTALINALQEASSYTADVAQLQAKDTSNSYHLIPTIEGITASGNPSEGYKWNPANEPDAKYSLLHKIKIITTTLTEIPFIRNTIADIANFMVNTNLDKLVDGSSIPYIFSIDIGPNDISKLFSSDQFISSILMQDPRYVIPDATAPTIPVEANIDFPIGVDLNFGRIIALMCNTGTYPGEAIPVSFPNIFQTLDLRSTYTKDNRDYHTTNVSYHKGDILYDLNLPTTHEEYDYAINTPVLESSGVGNFNLASNLMHNYTILLGTVGKQFEELSPDYYVNYTTIGGKYQQYGIGLGAFFICIGMCVGTLTQIMVYDKKKRVRRIRAPRWYRSKTLMMCSTSLIQGSILAFSIGCLGWFSLGAAFVYEWLFILFCGLIFVSIIQAIWFSFRYRAIGFFCVVVFMVLNLAAGWGTFPAYAQFPFFNIISNILPFTYMMHAQDAIIYGISTGVHVYQNSLVVLQSIGILLIYVIVFHGLGTFMAYRRERELYYGSYNRKHLGTVLKKLGYSEYCKINQKGTTIVDWKKLPHLEMPNVKVEVQRLFPYERIRKKYRSSEIVRDIVDFDNN